MSPFRALLFAEVVTIVTASEDTEMIVVGIGDKRESDEIMVRNHGGIMTHMETSMHPNLVSLSN